MSTTSIVSLVAVLALGGAAAFLYAENQELADRIGALEERAMTAAADADASGDAAPALGDDPTTAAVKRLTTSVNRLSGRLSKTEDWVSARKDAVAEATDGKALDLESSALDEKVRDIVIDMAGDVRFREKLGINGSPNLPKKPAFGQLAEVLELDATQEDAFRKDLIELKEEFLAVISIERDDGVVILDEIAKVEAMPEHDPKRAQVFMRLFTMKIPGTEETYLKRLFSMTGKMRKGTEKYLRPEQVKRFNSIDVDLLGVEME